MPFRLPFVNHGAIFARFCLPPSRPVCLDGRTMSDAWHLLQDGQQYGPYTGEQLVEFVKEGRIVRESMLWTEGMAEWARADAVEGLFPAAPAPVPVAAAPAYIPGGPQPPWMRGGAAAPQARPATGMVAGTRPGMAASPYATPHSFGLIRATPGEDYPPVEVKPTMFGLIVAMLGGGVVLMYLALFLLIHTIFVRPDRDGLVGVIVLFVAGVVCLLIGGIMQYIALYRAWSCLQYSTPRTSPGKAVGFMFIPLFNIYWIFQAYHGLAKDWNRIMSQHPNLMRMPRISEGLALTVCILSLAMSVIGTFSRFLRLDPNTAGNIVMAVLVIQLILYFIFLAQMIKGINAMAFRPTRHPGTFNIR